MTLTYFTGEQHSESFEQIIQLTEYLYYLVWIYKSKVTNQFGDMTSIVAFRNVGKPASFLAGSRFVSH